MANINIFDDIIIEDQKDQNQNIIQNNPNKEIELRQMNKERYETKLTLRKKKLNEIISSNRRMEYLINNNILLNSEKFHYESFILKNESFKNLISQIKQDSKDEKEIKSLLEKICYILEQRCKNTDIELMGNIYQFNENDLYENNFIEIFYELILIYLKNSEIMVFITHILYLSSLFIKFYSSTNDNVLYDNNEDFNKQGYFISSDKYIDVYNKIFEVYLQENNRNIIYFMIIFIATIIDNEPKNQENFYLSGTLNYIIDSIDIQKDQLKEYDMKIWCLSKFDLEDKFLIDLVLSLKIQKVYIELYLNEAKFGLYEGMSETMDESNIFYNFLKLIENTSYCTEVAYFESLLKSNILEFLMDNCNNKNPKMAKITLLILVNLTNADTVLLKRLIDIGMLKFLTNILMDKTYEDNIHESALIPINNLITDAQLWNKVLFDNEILKLFSVLLKDKNINENVFVEICYGIHNIIPFCNSENLKKIINEYYIIQLTCGAMKNILLNSNKIIYPQHCCVFLNLILSFVSYDDDELNEIILFKLGSINGIEIIELIVKIYNDIDLIYVKDEIKDEIANVLGISQLIKDKVNKL